MTKQNKLNELIPKYAELKTIIDNTSKDVDVINKQIKSTLNEMNMDSYETDEYKAKVTKSVRTTFNEEKMIEVLKHHKVNCVIKIKEYVDMDVLESMLYNGELSSTVIKKLQECKTENEILSLKVSRKKD